jgi:hypothetical protein
MQRSAYTKPSLVERLRVAALHLRRAAEWHDWGRGWMRAGPYCFVLSQRVH